MLFYPGLQIFNYYLDAQWLPIVTARPDLIATCTKSDRDCFCCTFKQLEWWLFYVKEETLWLNCSLGIFRAVTMLTEFCTFSPAGYAVVLRAFPKL